MKAVPSLWMGPSMNDPLSKRCRKCGQPLGEPHHDGRCRACRASASLKPARKDRR